MNNKIFSLLMAIGGGLIVIIVEHPSAWIVSAVIVGFSAGMYFWKEKDEKIDED